MDKNYFLSRVYDTVKLSQKTSVPKFLGFLTTEEASIANDAIKKLGVKYSFFGGYDDAERRYLACLPDWCDDIEFPISALTFKYRLQDKPSHRDFLGSFMALGLVREKIGDILVDQGKTVAFVSSEIADHIISQTEKIGKFGVDIKKGFEYPLPTASVLTSFSLSISSARLDCVVAAVCGISRSKASEFINSGLVSVNSFICDKTTKILSAKDIISVRGKGKFIIEDVSGLSKKGKIILKFMKYI